jgi:hypothetical protein
MKMNLGSLSINERDVNLEELAQMIRERGRSVYIGELARAAVRVWLEAIVGKRRYSPGAQHTLGETIQFDGNLVTVKSVRSGSNPQQGQFKVLTLALPDGTEKCVAAEVAGAPVHGRETISDQKVRSIVAGEQGASIRAMVQDAMSKDSRFVWFQDEQDDQWCLREMLPHVGDEELAQVADTLVKELQRGEPISKTTEDLVQAVWDTGDDGSNTYALRAFALGRALLSCVDVEPLGRRWVWTETWEAFTEREPLESPTMPTQVAIPKGVSMVGETEAEDELQKEEPIESEEIPTREDTDLQDLEVWRENRPKYAVFTLSARHYHEGWLPLTKQLARLFPPLSAGKQEVVFHHYFGSEPKFFKAWIDRERKRMWVSEEMHETFRHHRIYPGARLRLSYRTEREYDVAKRPPSKTEPVRVWRMWLEEGEIQYSEDLEPRQYDIDDDVFVADVRFEDLEALYQQAKEVGNSIFGLMYQKAVEWWEDGGRTDLMVTADQFFKAIHFDEQGRMVSKATIAWELWRRMAFKSVGGGRYLFRPRFGAWARRVRTPVRPKADKASTQTPRIHRSKQLTEIMERTHKGDFEQVLKTITPADMTRRILIRYVPKAGGRTSQVHFTREIAEDYFHFVLDQQRTIRLQQMRPGSALGPVENRPLVYSEVNRNCRIEVSGARRLGEHYPTSGQRPIIVFEEVQGDLFRYLPLLPGDDGYAELDMYLDSLPKKGPALPSYITNLSKLLQIWPGYPVSAWGE